ncbi:metallophosphoesterase [Candidatus Latescibacterota bacterium]
MKRRSFLSLIFPASTLIAGCAKQRPFYFIQMADTQIGMIDGGKEGNNFARETEILETVMTQINRLEPPPAFVAVCGDLTQTPAHEKQIAEYKRLMGLLDPVIPYYNVPGNHDFSGNPNPDNLAFYRDTYGPDWYSFKLNGWNFIALNSTLMKFSENCRDEADAQIDWLKTELNASMHKDITGTIVFMHHLFFDHFIDEDDGYFSLPKAGRRFYLDLFAERNVRAVFSGHRHTTIPGNSYRGVRLINTNAVCNSFDGHPGLREVLPFQNRIYHAFYPYNDLPVNVET